MSRKIVGSQLFLHMTDLKKQEKGKNNIYVGIGVCARSGLSKAIPFDIFSLILCAENYRRTINAEQVLYIIADTHALLTGHDPAEVLHYALNLSIFLDNVFKEWNIPHMNLIASFIDEIDYSLASKVSDKDKYMHAELQDMYYFIEKHKVGYKLGWKYTSSGSVKQLGFDEWYFDKQARKINVPLNYCYIRSGHTLNNSAAHVSPYICLDLKNRILTNDIDLNKKLKFLLHEESPSCKAYKLYLTEIQLLYCSLFSKPIKGLLPFVTSLNKQFY